MMGKGRRSDDSARSILNFPIPWLKHDLFSVGRHVRVEGFPSPLLAKRSIPTYRSTATTGL